MNDRKNGKTFPTRGSLKIGGHDDEILCARERERENENGGKSIAKTEERGRIFLKEAGGTSFSPPRGIKFLYLLLRVCER